jgi:hypothetical protein
MTQRNDAEDCSIFVTTRLCISLEVNETRRGPTEHDFSIHLRVTEQGAEILVKVMTKKTLYCILPLVVCFL